MEKLMLSEIDFSNIDQVIEQLEKDFPKEELELVDSYGDIVNCSGNCHGSCVHKCGGCGGSSCRGSFSIL